jgi:DNA topoisomerase I
VTVSDLATAELIQVLKRRRGGSDNLLAYKAGGRWHDARSDDVNAYIRDAVDGGFSAKDFRTWSATVLGAVELAKVIDSGRGSKSHRQRQVRAAVKTVSEYLGNTPAVCRKSYIDPKIIDRFEDGETIAPVLGRLGSPPDMNVQRIRASIESAVIELISEEPSDAVAA